MGSPRKHRKKYAGPSHPWQKARIEEEKVLTKEYGFKNKKEIWKMSSLLANMKRQAKNIIAAHSKQSEKEAVQLINRMAKYGLIQKNAKVEDVLNVDLKTVLARRLQTMLYKKGFARSIHQARQMIVHEHVIIKNNPITSPSYLVSLEEESTIMFKSNSPFYSAEHPERIILETKKDKKPKRVPAEKRRRGGLR